MSEHSETLDATVVVVGAGMSGLTAARDLHRRGIDVIVLEAADRVGGRTMTVTSPLGSHLDLGGQWIGHDHHRLMDMAAELGAAHYPMHTRALPGVIDGPRRWSSFSPALLVAALIAVGIEMFSRVGRSHLYGATLDSWLRKVPWRRPRRLLEVVALISWTADLDRFSVHAMAEMIRGQGGLTTMLSTRGGAQDSLLVDGAGALAERLAAELGSRVRTRQRVISIARDERGVTVRTGSGDIRAAKVVVTAPPPMAARIAHQPALPPARHAIEEHTYMGSVYKAVAVYHRPFWRERTGGEFMFLGDPGGAVFDTTAPGGPGHLCFLVGGPEARKLDRLDEAGRRAALLGALAPHVGSEVLDPVSWHEKSWHRDEYAGGGYTALPIPDHHVGIPPLGHAAVGHVHWAGSETDAEHPGYIEGAIGAGQRVAQEIAAALSVAAVS
ncbi:flavin monoamine oxidase family protein [Mycobacterium sp. NPDC051804]|uniref:flavin monoamine oxidase family protein n=1 Tax=Mycobacterium sp. NPDC051804 TaxID=3364295 RepID=UPI00379CC0D1